MQKCIIFLLNQASYKSPAAMLFGDLWLDLSLFTLRLAVILENSSRKL